MAAPVDVWDPMEQYDIHRPNDYAEFKAWKQRERFERQERASKRYRHDSDYTDSEGSDAEDYRPRKSGNYNFFFVPMLFIN
jgi:splicing factor 45